MSEIAEPKQLLRHELQTMLYVEQQLAHQILPELKQHVQDPDLQKDIERHLEETRGHVDNVRRALDMLGGEAKPQPSHVLDGLRKEHDEMMLKLPEGSLLDLFHTSVIAKNEHSEIAAYSGLIEVAEALGEEEVANLLRENLEQEEEALKKAEKGTKKLLKETVAA